MPPKKDSLVHGEDREIVERFLVRDEGAIAAVREKYGRMMERMARNMVGDSGAAEEIVSDACLAAWNSIPPHEPEKLGPYMARLTRNASLRRYRDDSTAKRGGGNVVVSLSELEECIPGDNSAEDAAEERELSRVIDSFLSSLGKTERMVFVRRYWYSDKIADIAAHMGCGESKVKMTLLRTRQKLRKRLEKEGIFV